jgi:hypothetical protein
MVPREAVGLSTLLGVTGDVRDVLGCEGLGYVGMHGSLLSEDSCSATAMRMN